MKKVFIMFFAIVGMMACSEERVDLKENGISSKDMLAVSSVSNFPTLLEVESSLLPYGVVQLPTPTDYVPVLFGYSQINYYFDPGTLEEFFVYIFDTPMAAEEGDQNNVCNAAWHSNEGKRGGCYNPSNECRANGFDKDRNVIIICCD